VSDVHHDSVPLTFLRYVVTTNTRFFVVVAVSKKRLRPFVVRVVDNLSKNACTGLAVTVVFKKVSFVVATLKLKFEAACTLLSSPIR